MTLNTTKHQSILVQILKDIYSNSAIAPFLGFKGGTAAYLFYGLNRFSVDLDFDLLDKEKEEVVFAEVKKIIKNYGKTKEATKKRFNLLFVLSYEEKAQNIKVEINCRAFGSQYDLKTYLGISMLVMRKEDMFANKLIAVTQRNKIANRDIFDVYCFLSNYWEINEDIIKLRTGKNLKDYFKDVIDFVEEVDNNQILQGLGEVLGEKQKNWVKQNLKKDVLFLLKVALENEK